MHQMRNSTFETNSSSMHSLTILDQGSGIVDSDEHCKFKYFYEKYGIKLS